MLQNKGLRFSALTAGCALVITALAGCGGQSSSSSSSSSASSSTSSSASSSSSSGTPVAQCANPAARLPANRVNWSDRGSPLTGSYRIVVENEPSLSRHTVYRPASFSAEKLPIVSWGNGGCGADGLSSAEFLAEIASHGYLVIANGAPNGSGNDPQDGSTHIRAIDWAVAENKDPCSPYYGQLDEDHIAVTGYSCGGLMALNAGKDTRLSTVVAMNSGLLDPSQNVYRSLHTPVAYFNGGSSDIAYENGRRDYQNIQHVPVYHANLPVGHGGTYGNDNGGECARVATAWLNWHLKGDQSSTGRGMFLGVSCGICRSQWVIEHKNFE